MSARTAFLCLFLVLSACGGGSSGNSNSGNNAPIGEAPFAPEDVIPRSEKPSGGIPSLLCNRVDAAPVGLQEVSREDVGERSLRITFFSAAMGREESAVITYPENYDPSPQTPYPVFYLLHGSTADAMYWIDNGVEDILRPYEVITVTPDGGPQGKYVDFYGLPRLADEAAIAPAWETFHIKELMPFIEANFPVRSDTAGRAIAGPSAGGYGATKYASMHPQLFGAVGSFSGGLNTTYQYPLLPIVYYLGQLPNLAPGNDADACAWGDPITDKVLWMGNDPAYLVENLRGKRLYITSGDGTIGELEEPEDYVTAPVELVTYLNTQFYIEQLDRYGLDYEAKFYAGTHIVEYWLREVDLFLAGQASYWDQEISRPASFNYRTIYNEFDAWGWYFAINRNVDEFLYFRDISISGFDVSGTGVLEVLTAPLYEPAREYLVSVNDQTQTVTASASGRLAFDVDIAPSSMFSQIDFSQQAEDGFPVATVTIVEQ